MNQDQAPAPAPAAPIPRRVRWWPAVLILVLAGLAYTSLWFIPFRSQQHFVMEVARIIFLSALALMLWVLLFSRLRWRRRLTILGLVLGALTLFAALFRVHGVTGNLVPILEPRWSRRATELPLRTATNDVTAAVPGAADFPQFLGPNRNGVLAGPNLATNWTAHRPTELWRRTVGAAWSGFAVTGSFAVTQEQRGEDECVVAYDLASGRVLWSHADRPGYFSKLAGDGPRATPSVAGSRVLAQGAMGRLNCLDLVTGRVLWSKDIFEENQGRMAEWGQSSSPLVMGDVVVVNPGGRTDRSLVAYRLEDGTVAWTGGTRAASHSSPMPATLAGVSQILLFTDALVGHDAATGKPLWTFRWPGGHPHVAMPLITSATDIIVSSGYGTGSSRVRVERDASGSWAARQLWRSNRLKAKFANLILHRGHVYGLDDGIMACLEAEGGALKWKDGKYGHGQVLLVGDLLLVMAESGEVILLDPHPDGLRELTRVSVLAGKTWNPPALAGEYLLARNDKEAVCFRMPIVGAAARTAGVGTTK